MAGRNNRSRRRRRRRSKVVGVDFAENASSSSYTDRIAQPDIPLPNSPAPQQSINENPAPRMRPRDDARALRKLLMSIIRGHYIHAISRLPAAVLTTARAHGLLVGGHCYGPFRPVENIIVNSVWYAAAFPFRSDSIDVAVVSAEGISRLAHRSLDGLVAILRPHCPGLSHDYALWHLCLTGADLHGAAASVRGAAPFARTELEDVPFQVAAQAAGHPNPAALALFVTSVLPAVERDALSLLATKRRLCLPEILRLSAMLLPFPLPEPPPPQQQQPSPREQNPKILRIISTRRKYLKIWYQGFLDIADAALRKFAHQTGERYHLHTVYGQSIVNNEDYQLDRYIHINFMACPKDGSSSSACQAEAPAHFFAEADNPPTRDCPEECITLCCMLTQLSPRHVDNCYACMMEHQKIDHPDAETHFGGHPHKTVETVNDSDFPSTIDIDVDFRFFDPDRDIDLMQFYDDRIARIKAIRSEFRSANRSKIPFDSDDEDISDEETSDEDDYCIQYV